MLKIKIDQSAADLGLASMLTGLIQQNVEQHPARQADFDALRGAIAIVARDAEVALTLDFQDGALVVYGGIHGKPDVVVATDSATVLDLSNVKLMLGLPDFTDASGRAVLKKIFSGELKLTGSGLLLKPLLLARFNKLLSVNMDTDTGLLAGETIYCRTRLPWFIFCWPALLTLAALGVLSGGDDLAPWAVGLFGVAAALWAWNVVRYATTEFAVTNKRVWAKSGLVRKRSAQVPLAKVASIGVKQGFGGRLLGYGVITIHDAGGAAHSLGRVARPHEFREKVEEQLRTRKGVSHA